MRSAAVRESRYPGQVCASRPLSSVCSFETVNPVPILFDPSFNEILTLLEYSLSSCNGLIAERMTPNETTVIQILKTIIDSKQLPVPSITPDTVLEANLGLESLDFAELVVRLEEATGKDPFANGDAPHVQTVCDLAALYDAAL
jgi:acyl carrier protein